MGSMKPYYELHVTYLGERLELPPLPGWSRSEILDDLDLGPGPKRYLTRQFPQRIPLEDLVEGMARVAGAVRNAGGRVLRQKVEIVVHDERSLK